MIISNSQRFIYVHIHKSAGTSLAKALGQTVSWNDVFCHGPKYGNVIEAFYRERFGLEKHAHASVIKKVIGSEVWDSYFSFSFVRNPYYRIASLYTWLGKLLKRQSIKRYFQFLDTNNPVWKWEGMKALLDTDNFGEFIRHEQLSLAPGAQPMYEWLSESGELIVDFIGKVENLPEDFASVCDRLNMGNGLILSRANVSRPTADLKEFYRCQEDLDYIYERYEIDFKIFEYEKLVYEKL